MTKPDPQALLACFRSGQMSAAQMVAHIEAGDISAAEVWPSSKPRTAAPPKLWHTFQEALPEVGRKIAAVSSDGDFVDLFYVGRDGWTDCEGEFYRPGRLDLRLIACWSYLPQSLKFYCEIRDEEPIVFEGAGVQ